MSIADKFRKNRGKPTQSQNMLEWGNVDNISIDELKQLAEHYGKQLLNLLDEVEGVAERKSNSKIELIADFIKVVHHSDRIIEYPAIEKLVKDAAKSVKE